ncbi:aspartic proteinase CDR1-like [Prosopis cineraria]|uniref:aspartic proteinase CDR1-like n=1 Tax=Prosopis cineraria TaxID=364024 RepID=UPI002410AD30|nr:aspartic proteinase CDR1-like [Prosopis cineraria]
MHNLSLPLALLVFLSISSNINAKLPKGFSIDLIHRDSPLSPLYNSSMTQSQLVQNAALRSMARVNRFRQPSHNIAEISELAQTDIIPNYGNYLMKIFIGTPPVERWSIADTGSDLIWVQCSPCPKCYHQDVSLFDPTKSSTYKSETCGSRNCALLPQGQHKCGNSSQCLYLYLYGDRSYTVGYLATESINFGTSDGQSVAFPKSVFGCGHYDDGTFNSHVAGLVGLGNGPLSLVSQLGHQIGRKFSYCLPPLDVKAPTKLRFGEEATISANGVVSTPMITNPNNPTIYYLTLEGITVGQQKLEIDQSNRNIVIDSGTTLTLLPSSIYEQVEALMKKAIGADQWIVQNSKLNLCYKNANSIKNFPNFEVHFTGANISLKPQNLFLLVTNDVICFAMSPTNENSIYGNVAQIDFDVEYDLDQRKISFAPVDCTKQ